MADRKESSRLVVIAIGTWLLVGGCATSPPADPLAAAADEQRAVNTRVAAIDAARDRRQQGEINGETFRTTLKSLAWSRSEPSGLRIAAIEALLEQNEPDTRRMLALMLSTETQWPVIERISQLAAERGWRAMTPALVRSWSREVLEPADEDRPERAALQALHPDRALKDVVFDVFASPAEKDDLFGDQRRREAWALLQRIDPEGRRAKELLVGAPVGETSEDPMVADLRAGARDLRVVPRSAEQLQWLRRLRNEHEELWRRAAQIIADLNDEKRRDLELRHVAALAWTAAHRLDRLEASRGELLSALRRRLDDRRAHRRRAGAVDVMTAPRETLDQWEERLTWADLLTLLIADEVARSEPIASALFEQVEQDRKDGSTEYGGAIFADDLISSDSSAEPSFNAALYPPRPAQRVADNRFVASAELLSESASALFHYHFHAQRKRNERYAGAGRGDLQYAERFGRSCLVFTSVNAQTLNVDYYQPNGARIDLGEIRKPAERASAEPGD